MPIFFKRNVSIIISVMKVLRSLLTLSLLVVLCSSFTLQKGKRKAVSEDAAIKSSKEKTISKPVYAFGFSASFSDSVAYVTPVHLIEDVELDKSGLLEKRSLYSLQLKEYLEQKLQKTGSTCVIYFNEKKKTIDKQYNKIKSLYGSKKSGMVLKEIPLSEFRFEKVNVVD